VKRAADVILNPTAREQLPILMERLRRSIPTPYAYVAVSWGADGNYALRYYEPLAALEEVVGSLRPACGVNTYALRHGGDAAVLYAPAEIQRLDGPVRLMIEPYDDAPYPLGHFISALAAYPLDYVADRDGVVLRTRDLAPRMVRWSDPLSGHAALCWWATIRIRTCRTTASP
jgi:hypothetical protein